MNSAVVGSSFRDAGETPTHASRSARAIGTMVTVAVTDIDSADEASVLLADDLGALDLACSRFRPDSEIRRLEQISTGRPVTVSRLLFDVLEAACVVAVQTAGIVDPTIGSALIELGYDRDFDQIAAGSVIGQPDTRPQPAPGWWQIRLDPESRTVSVPAGVHVDLGASAKAYAADRAAQRIAEAVGCGVLVNLGGDVAVAGLAPPGGWAVGIAIECTTPTTDVDQVVAIVAGGLATSGTTARSWIRNGRRRHHIVDPRTGVPADPVWSLVSTTASSCLEANGWSTAAVVWGEDAVGNLDAFGVPARLVDGAGRVVTVGAWPAATVL
jgi:FAD:protein FMN transferase